ncbi:MAG: hypothetical protein IJ191_06250 [Treponema sp.]|nr:hypothetical protein [Treponema sp.]
MNAPDAECSVWWWCVCGGGIARSHTISQSSISPYLAARIGTYASRVGGE